MRKRLLLAAVLPLLQGCGTTKAVEGALVPPAQSATVYAARMKSDLSFSERAIRLCEIDGKVVGTDFRGYPESVEVAPGDHTIKFRYYDSDASRPGAIRELSLKTRAGGRYIITFEPSEVKQTTIWIEDRITGEVVGGTGPSREKGAVAPRVETEILRPDWLAISPDTDVKLYEKSGRTFSGRVISGDGEYLWLRLSEGGKKALLRSEIDKIAAIK